MAIARNSILTNKPDVVVDLTMSILVELFTKKVDQILQVMYNKNSTVQIRFPRYIPMDILKTLEHSYSKAEWNVEIRLDDMSNTLVFL